MACGVKADVQKQSCGQRTWQRAAFGEPCLSNTVLDSEHKGYVGDNEPPVDLRAVCLVRAIGAEGKVWGRRKRGDCLRRGWWSRVEKYGASRYLLWSPTVD